MQTGHARRSLSGNVKSTHTFYYRVMHPVARNIKL
jgi:hypothetical protein